jgi:aminoglycoside 6'-N-acetyltransferase
MPDRRPAGNGPGTRGDRGGGPAAQGRPLNPRPLSRYAFRPAARADLPMLARWLGTPDATRWWGDPAEQYELLAGDLDEPRMAMRIVSFDGRPFAYAQHYEVHTWPQPHLAALPAGSRAIDTVIGEPGMLGIGHGASYVRALAAQLQAAGAPAVVVDPHRDNARARRAYARAGFRGETVVETAAGPAVVMIYVDDAARTT